MPSDLPQPEAPPTDIARRVRMKRGQLIGIGLMLLVPVVAMCGLLGPTDRQAVFDTGPLRATVRYPDRVHHQTGAGLWVDVENRSTVLLRGLEVGLAAEFFNGCSDVEFTPAEVALRDGYFRVMLNELPPGGHGGVHVALTAEDYGYQRGCVRVRGEGTAELNGAFKSLFLP